MHSEVYKNTEAKSFAGNSALSQIEKYDIKPCSISKKTISHTTEIITPIKLNDIFFKDYAISRDGDFFVIDNNGNFSLVEVITSQNSTQPTQVLVDKQKRSLPNIYADTFNISKPEANKIIRNKHSSFQPRTYRLVMETWDE